MERHKVRELGSLRIVAERPAVGDEEEAPVGVQVQKQLHSAVLVHPVSGFLFHISSDVLGEGCELEECVAKGPRFGLREGQGAAEV